MLTALLIVTAAGGITSAGVAAVALCCSGIREIQYSWRHIRRPSRASCPRHSGVSEAIPEPLIVLSRLLLESRIFASRVNYAAGLPIGYRLVSEMTREHIKKISYPSLGNGQLTGVEPISKRATAPRVRGARTSMRALATNVSI